MTTRITIINHGPDDVEVVAVSRATGEVVSHTTGGHGHIIRPGTIAEFYVHSGQDLKVVEQRQSGPMTEQTKHG